MDRGGREMLQDLYQDFRYAVRSLRQRPGFAAFALLTLALGIGATTAMFTVIDGVLLKPLPYPAPERLLTVHAQTATWNVAAYGEQNLYYPDFLDCRKQAHSLSLAGLIYNAATLSAPGDPDHVGVIEASADVFQVLGIRVLRGRAFLPEEDRPGGAPVAIVSQALWQQKFAGSTAVNGSALVLDGKRYTVVGVAPSDSWLDGGEPAVYTPLGQDTQYYMRRRGPHPVTTIARLAPGATLGQARAELELIGRGLAAQYPDTNQGRTFAAQPLRPDVGDVRSTLWLLLGAVTMVLLLACVNIASLLLARAVSRERELAMRAALGAGRGRLVRQCLTESAVLSVAGGLLGIALAAAGLRPFVAFWPGSLPRADEVRLDGGVMLFALAISLCSGLLFGLAPALRVPVYAIEQTLRAGARTVAGTSRRLHAAFVAAEIALAVVLVCSAGMLGRTLAHLASLDPGVNVHNVLIARMTLAPSVLEDPGRIPAAWDDVLERARTVPGVEAISTVDTVPMREGNNELGYSATAAVAPDNQLSMALATCVSRDYLRVMGISLHEGRFFNAGDRAGGQPVVVIDEVMARHAFGGRSALGKQLWIPGMGAAPVQVIGVVGHVRRWGLARDDQAAVRDQFYYPFAQVPQNLLRRWSELTSIAVRTSVPPLSIVEPLRHAVRGAGGDQVVYEIRTLEQLARASLDRQRFLLLLFGIFGGLALLLACIGIYGVLAYLSSRRVPEIGVRMALGATTGDVMRLVLRQSLKMIVAGAAVGSAGALAAGRVLLRLVDGMRPTEPLLLAAIVCTLSAAALLASYFPARRAGRVDPVKALRRE
jgi:predicted permease